ncbi:MAG: glycoside hydrolase family 65 protein [Rhodothalassiaceae bacterium]
MRRVPDRDIAESPFTGDGWTIEERGDDPARRAWGESVFALGDGFLGVRGMHEETAATAAGGAAVYLNGVYETVPITYHEKGFGFPETSDMRPPAANALGITVEIDGEPFTLEGGEILSHVRRIDLRCGVLKREIRWKSPQGTVCDILFERLVSLAHRGLLAQRVTIVPQGGPVPVGIRSHLLPPPDTRASGGAADGFDPRLGPDFRSPPWREEAVRREGPFGCLVHRTRTRGIAVAACVAHRLGEDDPFAGEAVSRERGLEWVFAAQATAERPAIVEKFAVYAAAEDVAPEALAARARATLESVAGEGFAGLARMQQSQLAEFWRQADVEINGQVEDARTLRFAMFQILQAAGRDGHSSVCAKGQTGEGYEGHYFWDAEIYVLPMLLYTRPGMARALLLYRARTLDKARENARLLGHARGALYPWRTIGGSECSAYFPAGSAQYHINADIAHAIARYLEASEDDEFLLDHGAEMLFETARIWLDVGHHDPLRGDAFVINGVTGPDEYSALVDNNVYTNLMAEAHLRFAVQVWDRLGREWPERRDAIAAAIGLAESEVASWRRAAGAMFVPYDAARGLHPQDERFFHLAPWDFERMPPGRGPLLLRCHPLLLYRHQIAKQADLVLALFLREEAFDSAARARDLAYYETVTVHDSTLSAPIFSIVASRLGEVEKAYGYFRDAARVDLFDLHGNSAHGLHLAALGGTWMAVVFGFAGMRPAGERLDFAPRLPAAWEGLSLRLAYRGRRLAIQVGAGETEYRLIEGPPLVIRHYRQPLRLVPGETVAIANAGTAAAGGAH